MVKGNKKIEKIESEEEDNQSSDDDQVYQSDSDEEHESYASSYEEEKEEDIEEKNIQDLSVDKEDIKTDKTEKTKDPPVSKKKSNKKKDKSSTSLTTDDAAVKKTSKKSRPPTAYNLYMKDQMSKVEGESQSEKLKIVAAAWKELKETEKEKYNKLADQEKEEWTKNIEISEDKGKKNKSKTKDKDKDKDKDKRPPTAYNLYMKDKMKVVEADSQTEKLKLVAALWQKANEQEKKPFIVEAESLRAIATN